jgi:peroxiredoxin family protein
MKQRHQLLLQHLSQHPADANITIEELKQMPVNSMSANQMVNRLQRYVLQGTNQYWYQLLKELLAQIEQKGCPTFFFIFSLADMH